MNREQAAQAQRISSFLQRTVSSLSGRDDLGKFVESVVLRMADELSAKFVFLFRHDGASKTLSLHMSAIDGRLRRGMSGDEVPLFADAFAADITPAWRIMCEQKGLFTPRIIPIPAETFGWPGTLAWAQREQLSDMGHMVLFAGDEPVGSIGFGLSDGRILGLADKEFIEGVAQQAAAAIRLADLGEQEKMFAISRERERSAKERAEELALGNEAMRRAIAGLAGIESLDDFLAEMLAAALKVAGAQDGAIVLAQGDFAEIAVLMEGSRRVPRDQQERDGTDRIPINAALRGYLDQIQNSSDLWAPPSDEASHTEAFIECHRKRGNRAIRNVPMVANSGLIGWLGLGFAEPHPKVSGQILLLRTLAEQLTVAVQLSRLAEQAKQTALAKEREAAAEQRSHQLAKATDALQATIESLGSVREPDEIVPRVLQIVAEAFEASSCAFYTNDPSGKIFLRYWHVEGKTLLPADMWQLDSEKFGLVRRLAEGFEVPESYLGKAAAEAIGPIILDHVAGTAVPEFDHFAVGIGWDLELNIGVAAQGVRAFTMCVYRKREYPFSLDQIELANTLAKQLGLAMETSRIAEEAREAAIARERQGTAEQRSAELSQMNANLRDDLTLISSGTEIEETMERILASVAEQLGARTACIFVHEESDREIRRAYSAGKDIPRDPIRKAAYFEGCPERVALSDVPFWPHLEREKSAIMVDCRNAAQARLLWPEALEWHREQGQPLAIGVPLMVGTRLIGFMGLNFGPEREISEFGQEALKVAQSSASLAAMALETNRLSLLARDSAIAEERTKLSEEMHDGIQQIFAAVAFRLAGASNLARKAGVPDGLSEQIRRAAEIAEHGIAEVRRSIQALRDVALPSEEEFLFSLGTLCRSCDSEQIRCTLEAEFLPEPTRSKKFNDLLRVVQEAVGNACKHSGASHIAVRLRRVNSHLELSVCDDGRGFDPSGTSKGGLGLSTMRQRAKRMGAELAIRSDEGGTHVRVTGIRL